MKVALLIPDNRDEFGEFGKPEPEFGPAPTALLAGLARLPDIEVHVISCVHRTVTEPAWLHGGRIRYHQLVVPPWGWLRTGYFGCIAAIRRKLRELCPDIVHGQGTERYCGLAATRSGFPNILTIHGNMREVARVNRARPGSFLWLAARLESFTLPRVDGVLCNSRHTQALVAPLARRTWQVPNALLPVFFSPPTGQSATPPVVLNVGAVVAHKDQLKVLRVGRELARSGCRFQLLFHGRLNQTSAYGLRFRRELETAQAEGWARHGGELTSTELVRALDTASALTHLPTEEAFGLVVAEALARNLKLFSVRVGGVPDIAEGVEGAELFAPEDETGLAAALARWLASGAPRPTKAADPMRSRYHPEVVARRHLEIYREQIAARPPAPRHAQHQQAAVT